MLEMSVFVELFPLHFDYSFNRGDHNERLSTGVIYFAQFLPLLIGHLLRHSGVECLFDCSRLSLSTRVVTVGLASGQCTGLLDVDKHVSAHYVYTPLRASPALWA